MQKEELKSLVTQMHNDLIENIDAQEETTKEQIVTFLYDAANSISSIKETHLDSHETLKDAFTDAYKTIAEESISSFEDSNSLLDEITELQGKALSESTQLHIDFPLISEKFLQVQEQMAEEVKRANKVITDLHTQVKLLEGNSNIDSLTKVFNRRALNTYLNNICSKEHTPKDMHLLLLDLDNFKAVNDTHGHVAGDKVLIFIANILKTSLRDGNKVFRYGGEEFVIILNRTNNDECMQVAKRILDSVRNNNLIYKGKSLHITLSIGATTLAPTDTQETLIERADKALYVSKEHGKDQINIEMVDNGH